MIIGKGKMLREDEKEKIVLHRENDIVGYDLLPH